MGSDGKSGQLVVEVGLIDSNEIRTQIFEVAKKITEIIFIPGGEAHQVVRGVVPSLDDVRVLDAELERSMRGLRQLHPGRQIGAGHDVKLCSWNLGEFSHVWKFPFVVCVLYQLFPVCQGVFSVNLLGIEPSTGDCTLAFIFRRAPLDRLASRAKRLRLVFGPFLQTSRVFHVDTKVYRM